jgi:AraC family transcriptional regulator, regulatory protein of adaptative response / DNA-3-methyladenine glycosylase II
MSLTLDPTAYYRAIQTKDARFDGQFFVAVRSTGIYCRPVCPATTPKPENCTFYPSAAAAQQAGFRPCLRCRPELAPRLFAYIGTGGTVSRALRLIAEGALDTSSVAMLAARLGISDRHLRQLFAKHLGTSPVAVAQTRRLQFAKQLIDETPLSMTDIATAAGFSSIRRFNDTIRQTYGRSPSDLRKRTAAPESSPTITLKLSFSPPYDWAAMMQFLIPRATPGLETASLASYQRAIAIGADQGMVSVRPVAEKNYLIAQICFPKLAALGQIVERLRQMFDLEANGADIAAHFQTDPVLGAIVQQRPGLRIPGAWEPFELAVRAILGQQVSVGAATTLAGRLVSTYGEPLTVPGCVPGCVKPTVLQAVFPTPARLATADLTTIGLPAARARAIATLAAQVVDRPQFFSQFQSLDDAIRSLCQFPGIGEWTAHSIALRALREPDAFPASDLGLLRSMASLGYPMTPAELIQYAEVWQPWRAYAAMHLWTIDD